MHASSSSCPILEPSWELLGGRHPALSAARARERELKYQYVKAWLVFQVPTLLKCFVIDRDARIKLQYCTPYYCCNYCFVIERDTRKAKCCIDIDWGSSQRQRQLVQ
eukprot:scaffold15741_cov168-Skeletonema_marinoi.AAC.13